MFSKYSNIIFNSDKHLYTVEGHDDVELTSVTTLIGKYKKEKNLLDPYCLKHNLDKNYVRDLWDIKGDYGKLKGTELHFYIENRLKNNLGPDYKPLTNIQGMINQFELFYSKNNFEYVAMEQRIYNLQYKIAGTIDCIVRKTGDLVILDWKSDKEIELNNTWNSWLTGPLSHVADININKYALQLSMYKYLLGIDGIDIKNLAIIHFTNDGHKLYKLNYMENEVKLLLEENIKKG